MEAEHLLRPDQCDINRATFRWSATSAIEILAIFLLFLCFEGAIPPGEDEPHYLCKAKHYWNPQWCQGDVFLESADAHTVFYWSVGWLTRWFSLAQTAWVGRIVNWLLLAWAWRRLSFAAIPRVGYAFLSAGLFLVALEHFHMAREWVVGDCEAKGFAYIFVFLGLEALLLAKWRHVFPLLGLGAAFHVIVGGWAILAAAFAWLVRRYVFSAERETIPSFWQMFPSVFLGFLCTLPGLLPCLLLNAGQPREIVDEGNMIYVYVRLEHHLVFHRFQLAYVARHVLLIIASGGLIVCASRNAALQRLAWFATGCLILAVSGALIDLALFHESAELSANVLRYYWYRLSDATFPILFALTCCWLIAEWSTFRALQRFAIACVLLVACWNIGDAIYQRNNPASFQREKLGERYNPQASLSPFERYAQWQACCRWIRENTSPQATFLTPRVPPSFLWFAERPEVVSWKNAPQDAAGLVAWCKRLENVQSLTCMNAPEIDPYLPHEQRWNLLGKKYHAQYVVVDCQSLPLPTHLKRVYPALDAENSSYAVYELQSE